MAEHSPTGKQLDREKTSDKTSEQSADFCAEQGGTLSDNENGCKNCEESRNKIAALEGEVKSLQASLKTFNDWKDNVVLQAATTQANECADLEIELGTLQAANRDARVKELLALGPALASYLGSLKGLVAAQASLATAGPKAKFEGNPNVVSLQATQNGPVNSFIESRRVALFGYSRDANGKIVQGA